MNALTTTPRTAVSAGATRTYGKGRLRDGVWHLQLEPHVAMRLKRVLGRVHKDATGVLQVKNTDEICRDLLWFMQRFPLDLQPLDALERRAARHRDNAEAFERLVAGEAQPQHFDLALPPRVYQRVGAEVMLRMRGLILADEMGVGKQQPVDTHVLTPRGRQMLGDLRVGDQVIGSSGAPVTVLGVYPQGVKPSYRVTFSDGATVEAGPEHLWSIDYRAGGKRWERLTLTTEQLHARGCIDQRWTNPHRAATKLDLSRTTLYLPMLSAPVQFEPQPPPPIPAYALGQLIANGSCAHGSPSITICSRDYESIRASLEDCGVNLGAVQVYGDATRIGTIGLLHAVHALGLNVKSGRKFIPSSYKTASADDRVALLQGLMDGDGSVAKVGNKLAYSTTSSILAYDLQALVEQLGGVARVALYDRTAERKAIEYRVRLRLPLSIQPFRTPRKAERFKPCSHARPSRTVVSVEYVRDVESVCIQVDAPDRLYATEHAILTHNTITAITALSDPRTRPALVVTLTALPEQWESQINRFCPQLRTHVLRGGAVYDVRSSDGHFPDVIITSYSKLVKWADAFAGKVRSVTFDEGQELRHRGTPEKPVHRYLAAQLVAGRCAFRWILSGTPIYNYGEEFLNLVNIIRPGELGERKEFVTEWCGRDEKTGKAVIKRPKAFGSYLRESAIMLRRTRKDVQRELPPLERTVHPVDVDQKVIDDGIDSSAAIFAKQILAKDTRWKDRGLAITQLDWRLRQATGIAKAPAVCAFVQMLCESGERVVVFAWHKGVHAIYAEKLKEFNPKFFTGSESMTQKRAGKEAFIRGESRVLVMSLRAGAGLDGLQFACRTVVFGELDWSPGVHEQNEARVYRDGQPDPVAVYYLVSRSGSDPVVSETLGIKRWQLTGALDPTGADVVRQTTGKDEGIRRLAAEYLRRKGIALPDVGSADTKQRESA